MINKIFYSLVLFPNITYNTIISGYSIFSISEKNYWEIEVIFKKLDSYGSIYFKHIDFIEKDNNYTTKNWQLNSDNIGLIEIIYPIILTSDLFDFNFFKPKEFG